MLSVSIVYLPILNAALLVNKFQMSDLSARFEPAEIPFDFELAIYKSKGVHLSNSSLSDCYYHFN